MKSGVSTVVDKEIAPWITQAWKDVSSGVKSTWEDKIKGWSETAWKDITDGLNDTKDWAETNVLGPTMLKLKEAGTWAETNITAPLAVELEKIWADVQVEFKKHTKNITDWTTEHWKKMELELRKSAILSEILDGDFLGTIEELGKAFTALAAPFNSIAGVGVGKGAKKTTVGGLRGQCNTTHAMRPQLGCGATGAQIITYVRDPRLTKEKGKEDPAMLSDEKDESIGWADVRDDNQKSCCLGAGTYTKTFLPLGHACKTDKDCLNVDFHLDKDGKDRCAQHDGDSSKCGNAGCSFDERTEKCLMKLNVGCEKGVCRRKCDIERVTFVSKYAPAVHGGVGMGPSCDNKPSLEQTELEAMHSSSPMRLECHDGGKKFHAATCDPNWSPYFNKDAMHMPSWGKACGKHYNDWCAEKIKVETKEANEVVPTTLQSKAKYEPNYEVTCSANKFCVGFEKRDGKDMYNCYGKDGACLWGKKDCATDEDCKKYTKDSPKYSEEYDCSDETSWMHPACKRVMLLEETKEDDEDDQEEEKKKDPTEISRWQTKGFNYGGNFCRAWAAGNQADGASIKGKLEKNALFQNMCNTTNPRTIDSAPGMVNEILRFCNERVDNSKEACIQNSSIGDIEHCPRWKTEFYGKGLCKQMAEKYPVEHDELIWKYCRKKPNKFDPACDCLAGEVVDENVTNEAPCEAPPNELAKDPIIKDNDRRNGRQMVCETYFGAGRDTVAQVGYKNINNWVSACARTNMNDYILHPKYKWSHENGPVCTIDPTELDADSKFKHRNDGCHMEQYACTKQEVSPEICMNLIDMRNMNCVATGGGTCVDIDNLDMKNNCGSEPAFDACESCSKQGLPCSTTKEKTKELCTTDDDCSPISGCVDYMQQGNANMAKRYGSCRAVCEGGGGQNCVGNDCKPTGVCTRLNVKCGTEDEAKKIRTEPREFKLRDEFSNRDLATEMHRDELLPGEFIRRHNPIIILFLVFLAVSALVVAGIALGRRKG